MKTTSWSSPTSRCRTSGFASRQQVEEFFRDGPELERMLEMLDRTNDTDCPWSIVEGNDKRRSRLNCIHHLLSRIPFTEVPQ